MKKLFYLLLLFLSVFNSLAQKNWCLTEAPTQSQKGFFLQQLQLVEVGKARKGVETITNVALKIHLLSKSNGDLELRENDIKELMDTLNLHFIDAKIQFYLCGGIDYINDDASYKFDTRTENAFCKAHDVNNAINLYLVKEFADPGLGGYAYFPTSDKTTNRIFCAYKNRPELITKIVPHEMGHYFGLLHTFQDAGGSNYSELVTREEKANCAYRGDLICDTPADPYGSSIPYSIKNCEFISDMTDANGDYYRPQIGNLMSYYRGCGNFFTPGQINMIKTGLIIRTIQNSNSQEAYSIDCAGVHSTTILAGDLYIDGVLQHQNSPIEICVETPFTITFNSNGQFKSDNEFKAYLIAVDNTFSTEIGKGNGSEIICKIPKDTPLGLRSYRLQVSSTSPAVSGALSNYYIYPNALPIIELSGSFDIFENEGVEVPMKLSGGTATVRFSGRYSTYQLWSSIDPYFYFYANNKEVITVERVWNQCGDGVGKGQIELNVVPKPLATGFSIENISGAYLCQGNPFKLNIKANGLFSPGNTFTVQLSDKTGGNFKDIAKAIDPKNLIEFNVPDDLSEGDGYKIKVVSSAPANVSISENLSVQSKVMAVLSGDTTISNGKNAFLNIQINGKTPVTLITSEGDSIIGIAKNTIWKVSPNESKTFSLKSASNTTCGNGQTLGTATVNIDFAIKTSETVSPFACVGSSIKVPFEMAKGISVDGLAVQLSDSKGKNFRTIPGNGSASPLNAIIPEDTPEGNNYRLRVISKNGLYIGRESNEFEIRKKPSAFLEGALVGNIGTTNYLNVKLTGGGPWTIPVNTGHSVFQFSASTSPALIPVKLNGNTTYTLNPVINACGEGLSYGQAISEVRNTSITYCMPQFTSIGEQYGRISRVRLTDNNDNMLLNSYEVTTGKNNYTDNTSMVAYLKPGGTYTYDIASSDAGSETHLSAKVSYYLIMWIDYDQNGRFDKNEAIVESALQYSKAQFKIPDDAKKGITRLRVRSYNENSSLLLDNPCATTFSGETEDYTIYITDETPVYTTHIKFAEIDEGALCKAKEYEFPFTHTGTFSQKNVFRVGLYNSFGQFLAYLGESTTNLMKIKFPTDVPIGSNYKLKIISSEPYFEGTFTKAFRINDIPTAKLSGNQTVYFGQEIPLNLVLDGGSDWGYSVGPGAGGTGNMIQNKIIIDYPGHRSYMVPEPGIYNFTMNYVVNAACGEGTFEGSARVEVLEPKNTAMISRVNTHFQYWAFNQAIFRCKDYNDYTPISFETTGKFDPGNFFTCHLIGPDDKFVAIVGYSKTRKLQIELPENIDGFGYKLRVVSSAPYTESPLSPSFIILPKLTAKISGYSEILPGEQGLIQLDLTGSEPWDVSLSDGTSISTNLASQLLKVSPPATQVYTVKRVQSRYCEGSTSGSATVKVLQPRASELKVQQLNALCIGGNVFVAFQTNGSFREKNNFRVVLSDDSGAEFKDIEAKAIDESTLTFVIPANVPPGENYKIKLVSSSPYLESGLTNAFRLRPISTATISSEVKSVYENSIVRLRIDFTGEAPYRIELSDGRLYANITQSPFFIDTKTVLGINKYTVKFVGNSCGQGMTIGSADLNVMPLPAITTQPLLVNTVCAGNKIFVPFKITNGEFQPDNIFQVDLYDYQSRSSRKLQTSMQGDSLFAIIPEDTKTGVYTIRVNGTNPSIIGSLAASELAVRIYPKVNITGKSSVMEGDSVNFQLTLSGSSPWTVRLSNGTEFKDITNSNFGVSFIPKKSETLTITSIRNVCGEGTITGQASFVVHKLEEIENLVKIYPNPLQQETRLYIDEALLKKPASYTITDISGRTIVKKEGISMQTPIDLYFSAPGIYYVRITTNKKQFFRKIAK